MPGRFRLMLVLPLLAALWSGELPARIYKWVDEQGQVHYGDSVPPDEANERRRREIKSDSGRTVDVMEPAPTREELDLQQAAETARRLAAEAAARQAERDRNLLRTFASVAEIEAARDDRLETIEGRIALVQMRIDEIRARLDTLRAEAVRRERSGGGEAASLYQRIDAAQQRIARHQEYIDRQRTEQDRVRQEFARDIRRFRTLTAR